MKPDAAVQLYNRFLDRFDFVGLIVRMALIDYVLFNLRLKALYKSDKIFDGAFGEHMDVVRN